LAVSDEAQDEWIPKPKTKTRAKIDAFHFMVSPLIETMSSSDGRPPSGLRGRRPHPRKIV
jgi:hypothetical protein